MKIQEYVDKSLILAIGFAKDSIWRDLDEQLMKERCNFLQAMALIAIFFEEQGAVTPSQLAQVLGTTPGNMSHCISALGRRRLLKRELDIYDPRSYRIHITPEGKRVAIRLIKIIDRLEGRFDQHLGKDYVLRLGKSIRKLGPQTSSTAWKAGTA